jgi:murein DD-endopeptidase MepM/ murein hydrolase activator NlpD
VQTYGRVPGDRVPSKRYTIILADRTTGVVRRLSLSLRPVLGLAVATLAFPVLMGLGARWSAQADIDRLRRENGALEMQNESYRAATGELASQISALQATVDELGARATVDAEASRAMGKLPPLVRSRAMGSGATGVAPILGTAFGSTDTAFGVLSDLLGLIEQRLESVRFGMEKRQALAAATPSIWPVAGWLSSSYGNRRDPFTGHNDFHPGLDISANHGEAVVATADGDVAAATANGNYGNFVEIDHGFGISTRYGHLSGFQVMQGQRVRRGDVIGYVGSTGRSTSPHLHYEIWMNGKLTNPMKLLSR